MSAQPAPSAAASAAPASNGAGESKEEALQGPAVPNVTAKADAKEQARLIAQMGNLKQQNAQFVVEKKNERLTLDRLGEAPASEEGIDLKAVPVVYVSNCENCEYTIDHRTTKVLVEGCKNLSLRINNTILTNTVEVWKCDGVKLHFNAPVKTLQLDLLKKVEVHFAQKDQMGSIVWQNMDEAKLSFGDDPTQLATGFEHMKSLHPDSKIDLDQFIIRWLKPPASTPGPAVLTPERCIRLKNGYLSTEREAVDWDRRNIKQRDIYVDKFLKEAGLHLVKDKSGPKDPDRNEPCSCGSGKKYKKCCLGKKQVSGLASNSKPLTYK